MSCAPGRPMASPRPSVDYYPDYSLLEITGECGIYFLEAMKLVESLQFVVLKTDVGDDDEIACEACHNHILPLYDRAKYIITRYDHMESVPICHHDKCIAVRDNMGDDSNKESAVQYYNTLTEYKEGMDLTDVRNVRFVGDIPCTNKCFNYVLVCGEEISVSKLLTIKTRILEIIDDGEYPGLLMFWSRLILSGSPVQYLNISVNGFKRYSGPDICDIHDIFSDDILAYNLAGTDPKIQRGFTRLNNLCKRNKTMR